MSGAFLRHWERAPASPTRSMVGREENVLWGLMCTALEYDAIEEGPETTPFWDLVGSRYIAYSFGADVRIQDVLRTALRLTPRMSAMYPQIAAFRDTVRQHPFDFKPFTPSPQKKSLPSWLTPQRGLAPTVPMPGADPATDINSTRGATLTESVSTGVGTPRRFSRHRAPGVHFATRHNATRGWCLPHHPRGYQSARGPRYR
ncbi:MAG: hypothetical protein IPK85_01025 [Gemmatimonadetes bacterium]|nr:hypothetical protein [Gemmatimonadota bacterium]